MNNIGTKQALLSTSVFWVSMTVGRALIIPISALLNTRQQLRILVIGVALSITLSNILNLADKYEAVIFGGAVLMGLFGSGLYPLTMSYPGSQGLKVTSKNTSRYALGGCIGGSVAPYLCGKLMSHYKNAGALFIVL